MVRYILFAILIYVAYQLIFGLVIPVYKTTRKLKKGFREMHARMNQSDGNSRMQENRQQQQPPTPQKENKDEYIDFEEVNSE